MSFSSRAFPCGSLTNICDKPFAEFYSLTQTGNIGSLSFVVPWQSRVPLQIDSTCGVGAFTNQGNNILVRDAGDYRISVKALVNASRELFMELLINGVAVPWATTQENQFYTSLEIDAFVMVPANATVSLRCFITVPQQFPSIEVWQAFILFQKL